MATKAAIYVRVSKMRGQNPENQLPALRKMAAARKLEVVEIFEDKMSGAKKSRPGLDRLKEAAHRGDFTVVLVWAIDRLGRSMLGTMDSILSFDALGVTVVSAQEPWLDMKGPVRQLIISIFAWAAEQERERIIERTHAGLEQARAEGKTLGRPKAEIDMDEALRLRAKGLSIKAAAAALGVATGTLHKALQGDDVPDSVRGRQAAPAVASGPKPRVRVAS